jgi:hypothetical protein
MASYRYQHDKLTNHLQAATSGTEIFLQFPKACPQGTDTIVENWCGPITQQNNALQSRKCRWIGKHNKLRPHSGVSDILDNSDQ